MPSRWHCTPDDNEKAARLHWNGQFMTTARRLLGAGGFVGIPPHRGAGSRGLVTPASARSCEAIETWPGSAGSAAAVDVRRADAEDAAALFAALDGVRTVVNLTTGAPAGIVRSTRHNLRRLPACRRVPSCPSELGGRLRRLFSRRRAMTIRRWRGIGCPTRAPKAASEVWLRDRLGTSATRRRGAAAGHRLGRPIAAHVGFAKSLCAKAGILVDDGRGIFNGDLHRQSRRSDLAPAARLLGVSRASTTLAM